MFYNKPGNCKTLGSTGILPACLPTGRQILENADSVDARAHRQSRKAMQLPLYPVISGLTKGFL